MQEWFSSEEVRAAALKFFSGDELATNVWMTKYALKEGERFIELSPRDSIKRYVKEFDRIENKYKNPLSERRIYELLANYKYFILAGSPMYGIGNEAELVSLGNCFVVGNQEDSYGGIMDIDESLVQIMKRRGGVGIDISHLRPSGSVTRNAAKTSTGAVSFMDRFSNTTREVAQAGRRGALMITIDISHPDVDKFITVKDDLSKVTGANISVKITDDFIKAVKEDGFYELVFEGQKSRTIKAKELWDLIVHQAWKSAEPGILFWDNIIKGSPADCYADAGFKTISTNPCSELPLSLFDSCRLGSMNVYSYVVNPFTQLVKFDWDKLFEDAFDSQKLMDDMIDLEDEKILAIIDKIKRTGGVTSFKEKMLWSNIRDALIDGRRTGLGLTGLADAAAAMGIKYGTDEFNDFAESVQATISKASYASSIKMAEERGAFPAFNLDKEKDHTFIQQILCNAPAEVIETYYKFGRRNIANLTIAPTGSLSILARVSSGIEPVFMLEYDRRRKVDSSYEGAIKDDVGDYWEVYTVLHPKYQTYLDITGNNVSSPYDGATSQEIDPIIKIEMQGRLQSWIDHSISVTYNLAKDIPESVIGDIYMQAWENGCKGVTVYREGSRDGVLVSREIKEKEEFLFNDAPKRPRKLKGEAFSTSVKGERFTVIVGLLNGRPYEVFAYKGNGLIGSGEIIKVKKGTYKFVSNTHEEIITDDLTEEQEAITRGYSFGLRHGGHVKFAVEQLSKTKGDLSSFNKAISRILKKFVIDGESSSEYCPDCDHRMVYESGCLVCKNCGNSKCQ